jgi:hypothetical protein
LTSISTTDAVNKDGKQLKVKMNWWKNYY